MNNRKLWNSREINHILLQILNHGTNFPRHIIIQMSAHGSSTTLTLSPRQSRRTKRIDSTDDEHTPDKTLACDSNKRNQRINKTKYKTEMCKNFSEMGFCPYRNKCQFAHGENEICKIDPPAKMFYRTRKCHSFWNQGLCSYGFRCQFSHYEVNKGTIHFLEICKFGILEHQHNDSLIAKSRLLNLLSKNE